MSLDRISRGVGQMLTKEGGRATQKMTKDDKEGGGDWTPPKLADIICNVFSPQIS